MADVLQFPKPPKSTRRIRRLEPEQIGETGSRRSAIKAVCALVWLLVRVPLFLVMYWLRGPVVLLCSAISTPMLLAFGFAWYAFPEKTAMVWGFGIISFLAFFVMWVYDFILMALSPHDMVLIR